MPCATMSPPAILDLEASGFGRGSYPIEVGLAASDGALFCTLIQPEPEWQHWDDSAAALHGITRDLLQAHGRPSAWVAKALNERLAGQTVYCDAWAHDYPWLSRLYDCADMSPSFRLADLHALFSQDELARWDATLLAVRAELGVSRHRASHDARVLQQLWCRIKSLT